MAEFQSQTHRLNGKSALVTGGTTGIGRSIALRLVGDGAKTLIFGRHEKELNEAIQEISTSGEGEVFGLTADQTKPEDLERAFGEADAKLGGLDILVNCAGVGGNSVLKSEYDEWKYLLETNLLGYMTCCRLAVDRMKAKKNGHIVNIGSMSADAQDPNDAYVASKAGVRGFTKSIASELNKEGIRITLIEPGLVGSDMTKEDVPTQEGWQAAGKMLKAEDIAEAVYYALSQPDRCNVLFMQVRPRLEQE